jgi:hypothetical protein
MGQPLRIGDLARRPVLTQRRHVVGMALSEPLQQTPVAGSLALHRV